MPVLSANLLLKVGGAIMLPLAALAVPGTPIDAHLTSRKGAPETITLAPRDFLFRPVGDFSQGDAPIDAPRVVRRLEYPLSIMKSQVTALMFDGCVRENACRSLFGNTPPREDAPATGASWEDATAYASWMSRKTGDHWRLPTSEEWAFAAGSRYTDDGIDGDKSSDFSRRWLAKYEQASARASEIDRVVRPIGGFGVNENGLLDIAGNVWEWTSTCFVRQAFDATGQPKGKPFANCGVRLAEGRHHAFVSNFIRDARGGGCAVGAPPAHLGFRLVRDERRRGGVSRLFERLRAIF